MAVTGVVQCLQDTFQLEAEAAGEVHRLAKEQGVSPSYLIGSALRFLFVADEAKKKNRKVLITNRYGCPIEEVMLLSKR